MVVKVKVQLGWPNQYCGTE